MENTSSGGFGLGTVVYLAICVVELVAAWIVYKKAGKPGWACLIPIYNVIVLLDIVRKPLWWIILLLIPLVNIVIAVILCLELAKVFGKGTGFGIGLFFLGFIFVPILAWGDAKYVGAAAPA
jgi:hypothetical protein